MKYKILGIVLFFLGIITLLATSTGIGFAIEGISDYIGIFFVVFGAFLIWKS